METTGRPGTNKDQARWQSEHGHWLKDLEIWYRRHRDAQDVIDSLEQSLKDFSEHVDAHKSYIEHHREIIRMHQDALRWRAEHSPKKALDRNTSLHSMQKEVHAKEHKVHELLSKIHDSIINDVLKLTDIFAL